MVVRVGVGSPPSAQPRRRERPPRDCGARRCRTRRPSPRGQHGSRRSGRNPLSDKFPRERAQPPRPAILSSVGPVVPRADSRSARPIRSEGDPYVSPGDLAAVCRTQPGLTSGVLGQVEAPNDGARSPATDPHRFDHSRTPNQPRCYRCAPGSESGYYKGMERFQGS